MDGATQAPQPTTEHLVQSYIQLRDKKEAIQHAADAQIAEIVKVMDAIEVHVHRLLNEAGEQSRSTKFGTAFKEKVTTAKCSNWDNLLAFIVENKAWQYLKRDVNKTAVEEYVAANGVPPPGVDRQQFEKVKFKRK